MGYNVNLERVKNIASKTEEVGTEIVVPIQAENDKRITVPCVLARCGATAQTLTVLQVKSMDYVAVAALGGQNKVTISESAEDLTGRQVGIQLADGSWFFSSVTASAAKEQTLAANLPEEGAAKDARFAIFNLPSEDGNGVIPLSANELANLQAPCPGLFVAEDFGYPMILHLTNETDQAEILGGTVAYIGK